MIAGPLPPDLNEFVQASVASGKYRSADELVCDAIRLLQEREREIDQLRREIDVGLAEVERGEVIELEDEAALNNFFREISEEGHRRLRKSRGTE